MRINVEFENQWTLEEVKQYVSDMPKGQYEDMYIDDRLELAACANIYVRNTDIGEREMNDKAESHLSSTMDDSINGKHFRKIVDAYDEETKEHIKKN